MTKVTLTAIKKLLDEGFEKQAIFINSAFQTQADFFDKRFVGLETRMDGLETRMYGLETRMDGLETRMYGLETRMDGLETRMYGLETRMDGLENRMDTLEVKVDKALCHDYVRLEGRVTKLEKKK